VHLLTAADNTPPKVHKDAPVKKERSKINPAAKPQHSSKAIIATAIQNTTVGRATRTSARLRAKEKAVEEGMFRPASSVVMQQ
jgi:hypothetical protein